MAPRQQPQQQMSPDQANMIARNMITRGAVKRTQSIFNQTVDLSSQNRIDISPRLTGLILGFIVNVRTSYDVADSTGTALTKTPFGAANLIKRLQFLDLNNNTRIDTTGWHLALLNSARAMRPYKGVDDFDAYPIDFGEYYTEVNANDASIAQDASGVANFTWFVPLSYSEQDLRGAVYANVINSTLSLQIELNDNAVQARTVQGWQEAVFCTADDTTAPADVTENDVQIEVLQVYYDQLPTNDRGGVILPVLDLQTIYELKKTTVAGMTADQDYPIAYSNFRDFLSTLVVYRNSVEANGFAAVGDVNYWALESANFTNLFKVDERYAAGWNREVFGQDLPKGCFWFSSRQKPISTVQYGNMNLVANFDEVDAGAACLIGYEAFALTSKVGQAGSLTPGA